MGITEILGRIWLFSANKLKSSESFSKQATQLIVEFNSSLRHIIVTLTLLLTVKNVFLIKIKIDSFINQLFEYFYNCVKILNKKVLNTGCPDFCFVDNDLW